MGTAAGPRLTGGGANAPFRVSNVGGRFIGGGGAVLAAVEPRREVNIFFAEEVSTSPNFYALTGRLSVKFKSLRRM